MMKSTLGRIYNEDGEIDYEEESGKQGRKKKGRGNREREIQGRETERENQDLEDQDRENQDRDRDPNQDVVAEDRGQVRKPDPNRVGNKAL